jgi:Ca-activated chloride channel family protein
MSKGSAQADDAHHSGNAADGSIRTRVNLVLVPVTVMDDANRIVTGLGQDNFHLLEDKHPQLIKNFWKEDEPVSIGILLDVSGSMADKFERAQDAVKALLQDSNPQDEFFLVTFANQPTLVRDFTQDVNDIQRSLLFAVPKGYTSLLDAVVLAVNNMKKARYRRRALVIISDGGDNRSRYTEKDVKSSIKESDLLVYSIAVCDREVRTQEERLGPGLLAEISGVTGASAYLLENPNSLPKATEHIAVQLRNQYILAYSPSNSRPDGKWRKIKVRLALPRGIPALYVQARTGYYGPK